MRQRVLDIAETVRGSRYPGAAVVMAAGSLVRGVGTAYSDLDLVVIFEHLEGAYRESFREADLPVEAFVHDPETVHYFLMDVDRPSGIPSLAQMILDGVELPAATPLSRSVKDLARIVMAAGPPRLGADDVRRLRYAITDIVDDLRAPRSEHELTATAADLYSALANYYLRTKGLWSAKGKAIPSVLDLADHGLAARFSAAFGSLFRGAGTTEVVTLAEEILAPAGGFLFEGFRLDAPPAWRRPLGQ